MTAITKYDENKMTSVENFGNAIIEEFIASRHGSETTQKTYRNACRVLVNYFASKRIANPTTADVDLFINELRAAKKSPNTIRLYVTVTKLFFSFLAKKGKYPDVAAETAPLKLRKSSTHSKKSLTDAQAKKLLNAVSGDDLAARRDRAIIALCLQCGLRTVEVARADVKDLHEDDGFYLLDVQGKGRLIKDETVKVAMPVARLILRYLELRGNVGGDEPLFASTSNNNSKFGNRYSEQSVGKMIKAAMKKVGICDDKISAHSARHYSATRALKSGVDIREVSQMLHHSSLNVTLTYAHDISLKNRRAELAVADALFSD